VVNHHAFCGVRLLGNLLHACAVKAKFSEQTDGAEENLFFQAGVIKTLRKINFVGFHARLLNVIRPRVPPRPDDIKTSLRGQSTVELAKP